MYSICIYLLLFVNICAVPISVIMPEPKTSQRVEETEGLFEGDIVLSRPMGRSLLFISGIVAWPNGIVPYVIAPGSYAAEQEAIIIAAMRRLENYVAINNIRCVQFRPKQPSDTYYIIIQNGTGCFAPVGMQGGYTGNRTVTLQYPGCIDHGRIMHELIHVLGFFHEQSRLDRDSYVSIYWDTIQPDEYRQYTKYNTTTTDIQNTPYDYNSLMHYEPHAFTINGSKTMDPIEPNVKIGQRYFLSKYDIFGIQKFYNCSGVGIPLPSTTTTTPTSNTSTYSSFLSDSSSYFVRPNGLPGNYYYEAIKVNFLTVGKYTLTADNELDTYGIMYYPTFNSSNQSANIFFEQDDQDETLWNFGFYMNFSYAPISMVLVVTTYSPSANGSFTVVVTGPSKAILNPLNPTITTTTTTTTTSATTTTTTSTATTATSTTTTTSTTSTTTTKTTTTSSTTTTTASTTTKTTTTSSTTTTTASTATKTATTTSTTSTTTTTTSTKTTTTSTATTAISTATTTTSTTTKTTTTTSTTSSTITTTTTSTKSTTTSTTTTTASTTTKTTTTSTKTTTPTTTTTSTTSATTTTTTSTTSTSTITTVSTTSTTSVSTTTTSRTTTTSIHSVTFSYTLTINSLKYQRIGGQSSNYYYVAKQLTISVFGNYTFSMSSSFATYAYLYSNSFDPSNPSGNLVAQGLSSSNGQFQFSVFLQVTSRSPKRSMHKRAAGAYYAVLTSQDAGVTGALSLIISGPSESKLFDITDSSATTSSDKNNGLDSGQIAGIVVGSVIGGLLLLLCLCGLCIAAFCLYFHPFRGRPLRSNRSYVQKGFLLQNDMGANLFRHHSFSAYYLKDGIWHRTQQFTIGFYPQADHTVYGKGADRMGTFIANGVYSPRTLRMAFDKLYQAGSGDRMNQNGNLKITVQVEWNPNTNNFEGKYYSRNGNVREQGQYIMKIN